MTYLELASDHVANLYPTIVYAQPRLMDLPPGTIIGTWAYSIPGQMRFILNRELELAPGVLPADLARAWVRDAYELPFKRRKNQMEQSFRVPLHARRGTWGDCSYVDIKGAYLKVLSLGYDVEYRQGHYLGCDPRQVPNEVADNKFAYSIAVAMSGSQRSNLQVMGNNGLFDHKPMNLYSNPCLFNLAQDTLNGIGAEVLAVLGEHVHYANTDGFIVDQGFEAFAIEIVNSWGFTARVKYAGETKVAGVGSYRVGEHRTKRWDENSQDFTGPLMDRAQRLWLKKRWVKWTTKLE